MTEETWETYNRPRWVSYKLTGLLLWKLDIVNSYPYSVIDGRHSEEDDLRHAINKATKDLDNQ